MNQTDKKTLMESLKHPTNFFIQIFNRFQLVFDESFFDYELLKAAINQNRPGTVDFLIDLGCRVRNPNKIENEETPLHLAVKKFIHLNLVSTLLINGASVYDKNGNGETALHLAFKKKKNYSSRDVDTILDYISNHSSENLDPNNRDDVLHFHIACIRNHLNSVKQYLKFKIDVNTFFNVGGSVEFCGLNPLHYAASTGYSELFEILLNHNGNLSIKNQKGLTPLHIIYYKNLSDRKLNIQPIIQPTSTNHDDPLLIDSNTCSSKAELKDLLIQAFTYGNDTKFISSVDKYGLSHFHLSCCMNYPYFVEVFIDNEVDLNSPVSLNCPDNPGFSPLHFAIQYNCAEVVELLLKHGADTSRTDKFGFTPLHLACKNSSTDENIKIVKTLLNYNACLSAIDQQKNTPVHIAFYNLLCCLNCEENNIFDVLMSKIPWELNLTNKSDISFFHMACTRNDINLVNSFLNSGVIIDHCVVSGKYSGYTALHFAVLFNQKDVVEVLLKRNAQVNMKTSEMNKTPLHLACEYKWIKYCKLAKSTDKPSLDCMSNGPNQFDIIKLLLRYGANLDAKDSSGFTPLFQACMVNKDEYIESDWPATFKDMQMNEIRNTAMEVIKLLLSNKANISSRANKQSTILHVFSKSNLLRISDELMECFISAGADINAVDDDGFTPIHWAVKYQDKEFVQMLLKHKANVNAKSNYFETPLQAAVVINSNIEVASISTNFPNERPLNEERIRQSIETGFPYLPYLIVGHKWAAKIREAVRQGRELTDIIELIENERRITRAVLQKKNDHETNISRELCDILLKNCSDINKTGEYRPLLYNAVRDHNVFLVQKLLDYGADINIKGPSGNISSLLNFNNVSHLDRDVIKCIYIHVQKLLVLGLFVSKRIQNWFTNSPQIHNLGNVFDKCVKELNRLKLRKIDNYTSLHHILVKDSHELSKHVKNSHLIEILEGQDIDNEFPFYSYLLKLQFKKGLKRSKILKSSRTSLNYFNDLYDLPDSCCDSIFKYLTDKDLVNLNAAVNGKDSSKRKLNDDYLNKTEPPIKLPKKSQEFSN